MGVATQYFRDLAKVSQAAWDRFWFTPSTGETLSLIRILAGAMLLYTHTVWSLELRGFFSDGGRISDEYVRRFHDSLMGWSYLSAIDSAALMWVAHAGALVVFLLLTVGLSTRIVSILAFLITVSYIHRAPAALFGLDQINCMLALYLAVGNSGAHYSIDAWRRGRRGLMARLSVTSNIAIRLIQCHMCVIYLFAALGKLQGTTWWEGTALWFALANFEYQTIDMTWLAGWPWAIELMSQVTVAWELVYCVLVWNKWTRPLVLGLAIPLHLGIAFCMGMITFGLIMLVGNLAFVPDQFVASLLRACGLGNKAG